MANNKKSNDLSMSVSEKIEVLIKEVGKADEREKQAKNMISRIKVEMDNTRRELDKYMDIFKTFTTLQNRLCQLSALKHDCVKRKLTLFKSIKYLSRKVCPQCENKDLHPKGSSLEVENVSDTELDTEVQVNSCDNQASTSNNHSLSSSSSFTEYHQESPHQKALNKSNAFIDQSICGLNGLEDNIDDNEINDNSIVYYCDDDYDLYNNTISVNKQTKSHIEAREEDKVMKVSNNVSNEPIRPSVDKTIEVMKVNQIVINTDGIKSNENSVINDSEMQQSCRILSNVSKTQDDSNHDVIINPKHYKQVPQITNWKVKSIEDEARHYDNKKYQCQEQRDENKRNITRENERERRESRERKRQVIDINLKRDKIDFQINDLQSNRLKRLRTDVRNDRDYEEINQDSLNPRSYQNFMVNANVRDLEVENVGDTIIEQSTSGLNRLKDNNDEREVNSKSVMETRKEDYEVKSIMVREEEKDERINEKRSEKKLDVEKLNLRNRREKLNEEKEKEKEKSERLLREIFRRKKEERDKKEVEVKKKEEMKDSEKERKDKKRFKYKEKVHKNKKHDKEKKDKDEMWNKYDEKKLKKKKKKKKKRSKSRSRSE